MISRFQYLTQDLAELSHLEMIEAACQFSAVKWIQLRVKNKPLSDIESIAKEAKKICEFWDVKLIINDYVEIAKSVNADGVHLGKHDMSVLDARKILGNDKIIGGTANTFGDIKKLNAANANYIGVGPFKFTSTKANLSDIVGLKGYQNIVSQCKKEGIETPIIAIGGIKLEDVASLMQTGIYGIAVSSAINLSAQSAKTIDNFLFELEESIIVRN